MPNSKSAAKRLRQDKKRSERNTQAKLNISFIAKKVAKSIEAKDKTKAQEWYAKFQKAVDKAAKSGLYHKNTAARKKSRMVAKVKSL